VHSQTKVLVTGATGFIGGNLVKALVDSGYRTRVLLRPASNTRNIVGLDVEKAYGDLRDRSSLERALDGCDGLFHVAAAYTFWAPDPKDVYETNVRGTENLLTAALAKGIQKVVYTSTESVIGIDGNGGLGTEELTADPRELAGDYRKSKYQAEQVALRLSRAGLPLVVVNPTAPVGPGDLKPTPTGQFIVDFLNGRMPAYVNTGLNLVYVGDVARGHVLAMEKGHLGERYILGNRNLTFKEILGLLEKITGLKAPQRRIPVWFALGIAYLDEFVVAKARKRPPRIPVAAVRSACTYRYFDCSKAIRELGLPQTPVEEALEKAVRWFRENGYAK